MLWTQNISRVPMLNASSHYQQNLFSKLLLSRSFCGIIKISKPGKRYTRLIANYYGEHEEEKLQLPKKYLTRKNKFCQTSKIFLAAVLAALPSKKKLFP